MDASQSAGALPVRQDRLQAAFIAMPGHKGLYGPQGTGVLLCGADPEPLFMGGTGSNSREQAMPPFLPDRLEAGTHNVPGIAGLLAGVRFVRSLGVERICRHSQILKDQLARSLAGDPRYQIFHTEDSALQTGVLSFVRRGTDTEALGQTLGEAGFALRAGYHCAPYAHQTAGTIETGTLRFSASAFNTGQEAEELARYLRGR